MLLGFDKFSKEREQLVIEADELVPNFGARPQFLLIRLESRFAKVVVLEGVPDTLCRVLSAIKSNTDSRGKDRIDKACCVTNENKPIPSERIHLIAVISLQLKLIHPFRVAHRLRKIRIRTDILLEVLS